jgi:hypothetical protein
MVASNQSLAKTGMANRRPTASATRDLPARAKPEKTMSCNAHLHLKTNQPVENPNN